MGHVSWIPLTVTAQKYMIPKEDVGPNFLYRTGIAVLRHDEDNAFFETIA
jgi:hypothetical protein